MLTSVHAAPVSQNDTYTQLRSDYKATAGELKSKQVNEDLNFFRVYKKAYFGHEKADPFFDRLVTPEYDLGYYFQGLGYYDGGHGMFLHEDYFKTHLFSNSARYLPHYLAYKVQLMTADHMKLQRPRTLDNYNILRLPEFNEVALHFKLKLSKENVQIGDFVLVPPDAGKTTYELSYIEGSETKTCRLHKMSLLQVSAVHKQLKTINVNLGVMWQSPSSPPEVNDIYCKFPKTYTVDPATLSNFNEQAVRYALKKNILNRKQALEILGGLEYSDFPLDADITFCGGTEFGSSDAWLTSLKSAFPKKKIEVVKTDGGVHNLSLIKKGFCNFGLSQGDVFNWFKEKYKGDFEKVTLINGHVDKMVGHLICKKSLKINKITELTGNHTLLTGSRGSGTSITFDRLAQNHVNLQKVRHEDIGGIQAIERIANEKDPASCLFEVSLPNQQLTKMAEKLPQLEYAAIYSKDKLFETGSVDDDRNLDSYKSYETIQIPSVAITNTPWLQSNPDASAMLLKVTESMKAGQNGR